MTMTAGVNTDCLRSPSRSNDGVRSLTPSEHNVETSYEIVRNVRTPAVGAACVHDASSNDVSKNTIVSESSSHSSYESERDVEIMMTKPDVPSSSAGGIQDIGEDSIRPQGISYNYEIIPQPNEAEGSSKRHDRNKTRRATPRSMFSSNQSHLSHVAGTSKSGLATRKCEFQKQKDL